MTLPENSDGVFTEIAASYDRINRILSLGQDQNWRRRVVQHLPKGRLLDLGTGTGAALPILDGFEVVGLDPEPEMLAINPMTEKMVGYGEALPFEDDSFDAVFSAYVFRNLTSVSETLTEIKRVLRPGGKAGIVDLARPRSKPLAAIHRASTGIVLPTVGAVVGGREQYRYLHKSLDKLAPPEELYANGPLEVENLWRMGPLGFVYGVTLAN